MATFDLTQAPSSVSMNFLGNTGLFPSPLIASATTIDRGGLKWKVTYNFVNISKVKRATLMGLMASLRGQSNRLRVPVYDNPKRGGYGGTPLVIGASQTGNSINLDGVTNKTDWIMSGDYFSIDVNGEHELKIATADADSAGGLITINFEPELRDSPLNNAAVFVEDGVLSKPEGIFVLDSGTVGWSSQSFQSTSEMSQVVLGLLEDVFATQ